LFPDLITLVSLLSPSSTAIALSFFDIEYNIMQL
jgi:hypothetical protein